MKSLVKWSIIMFVVATTPTVANADAVEINGICYNLITKGKIAEVTRNFNSTYTGDIIIPEKVNYNGVDYDVTSIGGPVNINGQSYIGGLSEGAQV